MSSTQPFPLSDRIGAGEHIPGEGTRQIQSPPREAPLQAVWEAMEQIPTGAYYAAVGGSIALSLSLYLAGKKDTAQFVGQWAPTFAVLGLMNKLLRPSR